MMLTSPIIPSFFSKPGSYKNVIIVCVALYAHIDLLHKLEKKEIQKRKIGSLWCPFRMTFQVSFYTSDRVTNQRLIKINVLLFFLSLL